MSPTFILKMKTIYLLKWKWGWVLRENITYNWIRRIESNMKPSTFTDVLLRGATPRTGEEMRERRRENKEGRDDGGSRHTSLAGRTAAVASLSRRRACYVNGRRRPTARLTSAAETSLDRSPSPPLPRQRGPRRLGKLSGEIVESDKRAWKPNS